MCVTRGDEIRTSNEGLTVFPTAILVIVELPKFC